ncbi:MAG: hypothetical protein LUK37_23085 [Clostridia bacterium]|nr:hypothetical protein [Clostridia bacterium]
MFVKKIEKVNMTCENCMHYAICGHKDHMKKALEQVETLKLEKSEFIKITAECTEFREIVPMPRGGSSVQRRT